ncbi:MAG TPA: endonuclease domain-containing protein [Candidatus Cloacimonadota bacterium]|nr:endonuclease domain-containing protein [Candidatus Cloacimonadota bacterium]HPT71628.1 endonuclease domain-containing protein [Candidatus Cloacimonadota bacterium]
MKLINLHSTKGKRLELRKEQTVAERKLWSRLRNKRLLGLKFYRQSGFGHYIADFYCPEKLLVIEVDGSQHFEKEKAEYDTQRTAFFKEHDIRVLRFTNYNVLTNLDGVMEYIRIFIEEPENVMDFEYI